MHDHTVSIQINYYNECKAIINSGQIAELEKQPQ